jgi:hypothetical protein
MEGAPATDGATATGGATATDGAPATGGATATEGAPTAEGAPTPDLVQRLIDQNRRCGVDPTGPICSARDGWRERDPWEFEA